MSDAVFIYLGRCVLFRLLPAVRTNSEAGLPWLRVWPTDSIPNPTCPWSLQENNFTVLKTTHNRVEERVLQVA